MAHGMSRRQLCRGRNLRLLCHLLVSLLDHLLESRAKEIAGAGSAVYVYAALASLSTSQEQDAYISFFLDDEPVGTYAHVDGPLFAYHIPVYVNLSIPSGSHTLRVQNGAQWSPSSFMILDSIVYTT